MNFRYSEKEINRFINRVSNSKNSFTKHTAFHGLRMPLEKAIGILIHVQATYVEFLESDEYQIKERMFEEDDEEDPLTIKWKKWHEDKKQNFDFIETPARHSSQELADMFQLEKKSVQAYFKKLADWCPEVFGLSSYADEEWFKNLKTKESRKDWTKIFNLLFSPDGDGYGNTDVERSFAELIYILVKCDEPISGVEIYYMPNEYYDYLEEKLKEKEMEKDDLDEDLERQWRLEWEIENGYRPKP